MLAPTCVFERASGRAVGVFGQGRTREPLTQKGIDLISFFPGGVLPLGRGEGWTALDCGAHETPSPKPAVSRGHDTEL